MGNLGTKGLSACEKKNGLVQGELRDFYEKYKLYGFTDIETSDLYRTYKGILSQDGERAAEAFMKKQTQLSQLMEYAENNRIKRKAISVYAVKNKLVGEDNDYIISEFKKWIDRADLTTYCKEYRISSSEKYIEEIAEKHGLTNASNTEKYEAYYNETLKEAEDKRDMKLYCKVQKHEEKYREGLLWFRDTLNKEEVDKHSLKELDEMYAEYRKFLGITPSGREESVGDMIGGNGRTRIKMYEKFLSLGKDEDAMVAYLDEWRSNGPAEEDKDELEELQKMFDVSERLEFINKTRYSCDGIVVNVSCKSGVTTEDIEDNKSKLLKRVLKVIKRNRVFAGYNIPLRSYELEDISLTADKRLVYTFKLKSEKISIN